MIPPSTTQGGDYPHAGKRQKIAREASQRAQRWVVERTHSWLNRFRRILVRWEKKAENYIALLHFACALIALRAAGLFG
jgi:putative transposase